MFLASWPRAKILLKNTGGAGKGEGKKRSFASSFWKRITFCKKDFPQSGQSFFFCSGIIKNQLSISPESLTKRLFLGELEFFI